MDEQRCRPERPYSLYGLRECARPQAFPLPVESNKRNRLPLREASDQLREVLVDGGYSLSKPEYFHQRLHQAGIDQTIRILTHQRGPHGSIGDAVLVDGQPFSGHLPAGEHQLDMPGRNADDATRQACVEKFNERAKLRYTVHTRKADGTVRYKCPFCVGRAHSPKFPKTMKSRNKKSRLVQPGKTAKTCCNGIVTADTDATFLDQKAIFGTTAWWKAWGRRNIVESANAAFSGFRRLCGL